MDVSFYTRLSLKHFEKCFKLGAKTVTDDTLWTPAKNKIFWVRNVGLCPSLLFSFTHRRWPNKSLRAWAVPTHEERLTAWSFLTKWNPGLLNVFRRHTHTHVCLWLFADGFPWRITRQQQPVEGAVCDIWSDWWFYIDKSSTWCT